MLYTLLRDRDAPCTASAVKLCKLAVRPPQQLQWCYFNTTLSLVDLYSLVSSAQRERQVLAAASWLCINKTDMPRIPASAYASMLIGGENLYSSYNQGPC